MALQLQAELITDTSGPLNPAFVDFSFGDLALSGLTQAELVARVALYLGIACITVSERQCYLRMIRIRTLPSGPYVPTAFPVTEFAAAKLASAYNTTIAGQLDYNAATITSGSFTSSGRGDSACVTTRALTGGRKGIGRHFIPFLARNAIDAGGLVGGAQRAILEDGYRESFQGTGGGILAVSAAPGVYSRLDSTLRLITSVQASQIPSRLRSRTK